MRLLKQHVVAVTIVIVNFCFVPMVSQSLRAPEWKEEKDASSNSSWRNPPKGTELRLSCAVKGHPKPDVYWYKNDEKIKPRAHTLRLTDIQPSDQGNYTCIANNSLGKIEFTFVVDVKEPPEWKEDSDTHPNSSVRSMIEGTELKLSCSAKGDPKPDVFWYKDDTHFLPNSDRINVAGHILKFSDIQRHDQGNYTCTANNSLGKIEFTFIVDVKVVNVSERLTVYEGEDARFHCVVLDDKTAMIQWLRIKTTDESQAKESQTRDESSNVLVIPRVTKDDGGRYTCLISNRHGTKSYHMHLTVLEVTTTTTPTTTTTTIPTTTTKTTTTPTTTTATTTTTTVKTRPTSTEKPKPKKKKPIKKKNNKTEQSKKTKKNKKKKDPDYNDEDFDHEDNSEGDTNTPYMVDNDDRLNGKEYSIWKTYNIGEKSNFSTNTNMYEPKPPNTDTEMENENIHSPDARPDGDVEDMEKNDDSDIDARNATANVSSASKGGIGVWTVYIIVGAVAGGLLLAGLVAITIALFCQHKDESQCKSTSV